MNIHGDATTVQHLELVLNVERQATFLAQIPVYTYRKILKISPPNPPPGGASSLKLPSNTKYKTEKNGKFPSKNKASPIEFEMQISLRTQAPPKISHWAYFRNFTVYEANVASGMGVRGLKR